MKRELRKAIYDSIRHWEKDIVQPLKQKKAIGRKADRTLFWVGRNNIVKCDGKHCPLCQYCLSLTSRYDFVCNYCILSKINNECDNEHSSWSKFIDNPCLETAENMVKALRKCLSVKDIQE